MMANSLRLAWPQMAADTAHGYGYVSSALRRAMIASGNATTCDTYESDWDAVIMVSPPVPWIFPSNGRRDDVILHTMYEATPLPTDWIAIINRSGGVWTPSTWCKTMFEESGVIVPIFVSGYGVDTDLFSFTNRRDGDGPFRVLVWGDFLHSRKNVMKAIDVFLAANIPDSVLEVKLSGLISHNDCLDGVLDYIHTDGKRHENIIINIGIWPVRRLIQWLHTGTVGLYLSAGEGFGLMPLQMMATGLPLVCSYNTGMTEYLTEDTALCVPCASVETTLYEHPAWNEEPLFSDAVDRLRFLYDHPYERHARGQRSAVHAATFTWEKAAENALEEIRNHVNTYSRACSYTHKIQRTIRAKSWCLQSRRHH